MGEPLTFSKNGYRAFPPKENFESLKLYSFICVDRWIILDVTCPCRVI